MTALRAVNLVVRFLLEIAALIVFSYWGWTLQSSTATRAAAALLIPLLVAGLWGMFIAPKARVPTGRLGRAGLGLVVFLGAAAALAARQRTSLAEAFAAVAIVSSLIVYALPQ